MSFADEALSVGGECLRNHFVTDIMSDYLPQEDSPTYMLFLATHFRDAFSLCKKMI